VIGVSIAEKNVAAVLFVIIAGRFASAGKEGLVLRFGLRVDLAIAHQGFLRAIARNLCCRGK
jgi:hypothetical protein